jgi:hypothetical protein
VADHDEVIPLWSVRREVAQVPNAEVLVLSGSHFDVYKGSFFEEAIAAEQDFFVTHLQNQ